MSRYLFILPRKPKIVKHFERRNTIFFQIFTVLPHCNAACPYIPNKSAKYSPPSVTASKGSEIAAPYFMNVRKVKRME